MRHAIKERAVRWGSNAEYNREVRSERETEGKGQSTMSRPKSVKGEQGGRGAGGAKKVEKLVGMLPSDLLDLLDMLCVLVVDILVPLKISSVENLVLLSGGLHRRRQE